AAADTAAEVIANSFRIGARRQLARNTLCIDANLRRVREQIRVLQRILVVKQQVVHLPEMSLRAGRLGCFCRPLGVRVRLREREVSENKSEIVAHVAADALNYRMGAAAVRTFEVTV